MTDFSQLSDTVISAAFLLPFRLEGITGFIDDKFDGILEQLQAMEWGYHKMNIRRWAKEEK